MSEVRLIDANALKEIAYINKGNFNTVEGIRDWIDNAPTIDAIPTELHEKIMDKTVDELLECQSNLRPQGEWLLTSGSLKCPFCGFRDYRKTIFNYCSVCGADMRGEKTNG